MNISILYRLCVEDWFSMQHIIIIHPEKKIIKTCLKLFNEIKNDNSVIELITFLAHVVFLLLSQDV